MDCKSAREMLPAYLMGDLAAAGMDEVRGHLAGCPLCAVHSRELQATLDLLGNALAEDFGAPARLSPERRRAVLTSGAASPEPKVLSWWLASHRATAVAASLVAVAGVSWLLVANTRPRVVTSPQSSAPEPASSGLKPSVTQPPLPAPAPRPALPAAKDRSDATPPAAHRFNAEARQAPGERDAKEELERRRERQLAKPEGDLAPGGGAGGPQASRAKLADDMSPAVRESPAASLPADSPNRSAMEAGSAGAEELKAGSATRRSRGAAGALQESEPAFHSAQDSSGLRAPAITLDAAPSPFRSGAILLRVTVSDFGAERDAVLTVTVDRSRVREARLAGSEKGAESRGIFSFDIGELPPGESFTRILEIVPREADEAAGGAPLAVARMGGRGSRSGAETRLAWENVRGDLADADVDFRAAAAAAHPGHGASLQILIQAARERPDDPVLKRLLEEARERRPAEDERK
jgi:hypothetical protein